MTAMKYLLAAILFAMAIFTGKSLLALAGGVWMLMASLDSMRKRR